MNYDEKPLVEVYRDILLPICRKYYKKMEEIDDKYANENDLIPGDKINVHSLEQTSNTRAFAKEIISIDDGWFWVNICDCKKMDDNCSNDCDLECEGLLDDLLLVWYKEQDNIPNEILQCS